MSPRRPACPQWPTFDTPDVSWPKPGSRGAAHGLWPSRAAPEDRADRTDSSDGGPLFGRLTLVGLPGRWREPVMGHEVERSRQARPVARLDVVPGHQDHLLSRRKLPCRSLVRVAVRGHDHVIAVSRIVEEGLYPVELLA